jgi:nicotinamidase/pyrazinamidase
MEQSKILFWNVDTQADFIELTGKLYAPGAEKIKPILKEITEYAKLNGIRVISTCDYHNINSPELSSNPNYITSVPEHCMAGTPGAEYITETKPENPFIIDWSAEKSVIAQLERENPRNIVIRKDVFDVFAGNPYTDRILQLIAPEKVFAYGVTTNVCVDQAVMGLIDRSYKVYVFQDAIKELPKIPLPFDKWRSCGVEMINFRES